MYTHTHTCTVTRTDKHRDTDRLDTGTDTHTHVHRLCTTKDLGTQYIVVWHENKLGSLGQLSGSKVGADTAEN